MIQEPGFILGNSHTDERGVISFINDLQLNSVKRFYVIEPANVGIVRAWQAHKTEQKWFFVVSGSFKVLVVKPDHWKTPSPDLEVREFILTGEPAVLHIPGGYANGFQALEPGSKLMVFSDFTVEQSAADDYRFDQGLWYQWT